MSNVWRTKFDNWRSLAPLFGARTPAASPRPGVSPRALLHDALPQLCALCSAPCGRRLLCAACERALPRLGPACPHCALPAIAGDPCPHCLRRPPPWTQALAAFAYAYPLDRLLHAFKYRGELAYAPLFAEALARQVRGRPDAVVAVPLAARRQRERGYNQALEIARPLAHDLGLPLHAALARTRDSQPLAGLSWRLRGASVRGAFVAVAPVRGVSVALVDDVLTTGATLRAATLALLAAGAARVDVWVVARTLPPSS
ncbi:MAG: ComF family protein [Burkholderiales bacterium]|nr:ComF family protein [Burkholderiales bacterium]